MLQLLQVLLGTVTGAGWPGSCEEVIVSCCDGVHGPCKHMLPKRHGEVVVGLQYSRRLQLSVQAYLMHIWTTARDRLLGCARTPSAASNVLLILDLPTFTGELRLQDRTALRSKELQTWRYAILVHYNDTASCQSLQTGMIY